MKNKNELRDKVTVVKDYIKKEFPDRKLLIASVFGSQKYKLNDENSDYDMVTFVTPTFDDLYENKVLSIDRKLDNIDIKIFDIRRLSEFIEKSTMLGIEVLLVQDTDYFSKEVSGIKEMILNNSNKWSKQRTPKLHFVIRSLMLAKLEAIKKDLPSQPTNEGYKRRIKYGFDTKQLLHIVRLAHLADKLRGGGNILEELIVDEKLKTKLLNIKNNKGNLTKEQAIKIGSELLELEKETLKEKKVDSVNNPEKLKEEIKRVVKKELLSKNIKKSINLG